MHMSRSIARALLATGLLAVLASGTAVAQSSAVHIREVAPRIDGDEPEWLELEATESLEIQGWQLVGDAGVPYAIPDPLPPLDPGMRVLVRFDGLSPELDDYDLTDGLAVLHAPPGALGDEIGQVGLYTGPLLRPETITTSSPWGAPPGAAGIRRSAGRPVAGRGVGESPSRLGTRDRRRAVAHGAVRRSPAGAGRTDRTRLGGLSG